MRQRWTSPFGAFDVVVGDLGVSGVQVPDETTTASLDKDLEQSFNGHVHGQPTSMRLDLHTVAPLRQVTLAKLLEIPFGEVRSYAWLAREIGRPSAIRAVASAVAKNPIPLLIPCHRIIRSDGRLGEYSLVSPQLKRDILAFEGLDIAWLESLTIRGIRYLADSDANCFHERTCRLAPKAGDPNYVELKSAAVAEERRYKPCRRCRPVHVY